MKKNELERAADTIAYWRRLVKSSLFYAYLAYVSLVVNAIIVTVTPMRRGYAILIVGFSVYWAFSNSFYVLTAMSQFKAAKHFENNLKENHQD